MLGFIWFYSSESGLFNGLQRIQIKILVPQSGTRPGCKAMELTGPTLIGTVAGLSAIEFVIHRGS